MPAIENPRTLPRNSLSLGGMVTTLILGTLSTATQVPGQTPYMLVDVNTKVRGTKSSTLLGGYGFHVVGSKVYFRGITGSASRPFVHDLSTRQTTQLSFVLSGAYFTSMGGKVYFIGDSPSGRSLCVTDGTLTGTKVIGSAPGALYLVAVGTQLFFSGTSSRGRELHVSDGTTIRLAKDIHTSGDGNPWNLTPSGPLLFFTAEDGTHGRELWRSDGTAAGTRMVKDIHAQASSANPSHLTAIYDPVQRKHTLLFEANSAAGREPWVSDGSVLGTRLLRNIRSGSGDSSPRSFVYDTIGKRWFFVAEDGAHGSELWKSDLSATGTVMVQDIRFGSLGSHPTRLGVHGGRVFFTADNGLNGREPWVSDGTAAGTTLVRDVQPGSGSGASGGVLAPYSSTGAHFFFMGIMSTGNRQLWKSDGTKAGTVLVRDIAPEFFMIETAVTSSGELLFAGDDGIHGHEPWITSGSPGGTRMLADINTTPDPDVTHDADPGHGLSRLDSVWFAATDDTDDKLGRTDGTAAGTGPLPVSASWTKSAQGLTQTEGGTAYWTALDGLGKRRLLTSSGVLTNATNVANLTAVGDRLFFTAEDPIHGNELWTSLGASQTTHLVRDVTVGSNGSSPTYFAPFRGTLCFIAKGQLWRTDGTTAGTSRLRQFSTGPILATRSAVYFVGIDKTTTGVELWKTDGTVAGTVLVKDINPGSGYSSPIVLGAIGDTVLLSAGHPSYGRELWKSDGTAAGTSLVKDLLPGTTGSHISSATVVGDRMVFSCLTSRGNEVWISDGTTAGTLMVKNVAPKRNSNPGPFFATSKNHIWFPATTPDHGRELWVTDGTTAGTRLVADLIKGSRSSDPEILGVTESDKSRLIFAATDWQKGRELFALDLPGATRTIGQGCAHGIQPPTMFVDPALSPLFTIAAFGGTGVRPNGNVFALVSPKPKAPLPFLGCAFFIDANFVLIGTYAAKNGAWKDSIFVNFNASHLGMQIAWQAAAWPAPGPLGVDLTNGVITTFGK